MKYLMKFKTFNENMVGNMERQEYVVGDEVKLDTDDVAKIVKVNSKNSYIVNIMQNHAFVPKPVEVTGERIVDFVKPNNAPATGSDIMQKSQTDPSNDFVINGGYPDTPVANTIPY